jgi:hypothetical protein
VLKADILILDSVDASCLAVRSVKSALSIAAGCNVGAASILRCGSSLSQSI